MNNLDSKREEYDRIRDHRRLLELEYSRRDNALALLEIQLEDYINKEEMKTVETETETETETD